MTGLVCMEDHVGKAGIVMFATALRRLLQEQLAEMVSPFYKGFPELDFKLAFYLAAATLKFSGGEVMSLRYTEGITNEAEDISIRFRSVEQAGLLLVTR